MSADAEDPSHNLESIAARLVAYGKGILAADETTATLTKRFDTLGIAALTERSRRTYREMLFSSPGAADLISGAIMYDKTIRKKRPGGMPFAEQLESQGVLPGINVYRARSPCLLKRPLPKGLTGDTAVRVSLSARSNLILMEVVDAARAAPSNFNSQSWPVYLLTGKAKDALSDNRGVSLQCLHFRPSLSRANGLCNAR